LGCGKWQGRGKMLAYDCGWWVVWVIGQLALNRDGCELGATVEVVTFDPQCSRGLICPTVAFKCQLVLLLWFQFLPLPPPSFIFPVLSALFANPNPFFIPIPIPREAIEKVKAMAEGPHPDPWPAVNKSGPPRIFLPSREKLHKLHKKFSLLG